MDIFEYARSINFMADYLDMHTGYIYKLTEYDPNTMPGIPVYEDGKLIGYAKEND